MWIYLMCNSIKKWTLSILWPNFNPNLNCKWWILGLKYWIRNPLSNLQSNFDHKLDKFDHKPNRIINHGCFNLTYNHTYLTCYWTCPLLVTRWTWVPIVYDPLNLQPQFNHKLDKSQTCNGTCPTSNQTY